MDVCHPAFEAEALRPFTRAAGWSIKDLLVSGFGFIGEHMPLPVIEPELEETPERVLRRKAAALGVNVLDFRERNRKQPHGFRHHCIVTDDGVIHSVRKGKAVEAFLEAHPSATDYGIWGWFGGGKNMPTRGRAHGRIKWVRNYNTTLHTMAVGATAPRCIGMPVQNAIDRFGNIVLLQSISALMWHAHSANRFSDGIEISGNGTITEIQAAAARILLEYVIASKRRNLRLAGIDVEAHQLTVEPHALSHRSRWRDCGDPIWRAVGVYGIEELGLMLGPMVGSGRQPDWCPGIPRNKKRDMRRPQALKEAA